MMCFSPGQLVVGLIIGGLAVVLNMLALMMIGHINEKAADKEKVSYVWWGRGILKQYRALYPTSKLPLLYRTVEVLMLLSFLAGLWVLGILEGIGPL